MDNGVSSEVDGSPGRDQSQAEYDGVSVAKILVNEAVDDQADDLST